MVKAEKNTKKVERRNKILMVPICKLVILAFVIGLFSCTGCSSFFRIKGDGNLITSEKTVSTFEKINSGGVPEVRYYASEQYRVVVTIDANLDEYVEVFTQNNVLNIRTQRGNNYKFTKFLVEVYSPVLTGVSISGSGSFAGADKIIASTFEANVSGSGKIEVTIESDNFAGKISGSGLITVVGISKNANISISGSGNFNGSNFNAKNATVNISGSGKANICVEEILNVRVSGSGSVNYCGEPQVNSSISGSGSLRKM